jgi:hypothetical protein
MGHGYPTGRCERSHWPSLPILSLGEHLRVWWGILPALNLQVVTKAVHIGQGHCSPTRRSCQQLDKWYLGWPIP